MRKISSNIYPSCSLELIYWCWSFTPEESLSVNLVTQCLLWVFPCALLIKMVFLSIIFCRRKYLEMKFDNLLVPSSHSFIFHIVQSTFNWTTWERWFWVLRKGAETRISTKSSSVLLMEQLDQTKVSFFFFIFLPLLIVLMNS